MITRKDFLATAAGIAATLAASKVALAATTTPSPTQPPSHGELGSARNVKRVRAALERLIDQLQQDQHDFGGYRVKAVAAMQQARADLDQALQWDATHPR
jgi:hypothetical protein